MATETPLPDAVAEVEAAAHRLKAKAGNGRSSSGQFQKKTTTVAGAATSAVSVTVKTAPEPLPEVTAPAPEVPVAPPPPKVSDEPPEARDGVPYGFPEERVMRPIKGAYDNHGEFRSGQGLQDAEETVTFIARIQQPRIHVSVRRIKDDLEHYQQHSIVFQAYTFSTRDAALIETMKEHPGFGGSQSKNFKDRPRNARQPHYWIGGYPPDIARVIKEEREQHTKEKGRHEEGEAAMPAQVSARKKAQ